MRQVRRLRGRYDVHFVANPLQFATARLTTGPRIHYAEQGDHGGEPIVFPREHQDRLAGAIRGATLTVYPETGHCPNWERPDHVAADRQAFLHERP